ncbi:MAG: HRDC domain-containing protein, partial [bacterium]
LFADSKIEKIFQGADYDVGLLKRDFGYECNHLFDTMVAAQFLNHEKIGMADLVEKYFGIRLEKKFTKSNWLERPLSIEQMVYLCQDTQYLIGMRDFLSKELEARDLLEEAEIEFKHLEKRPPLEPAYEHMTVWDIKGAKGLEKHQMPVLNELFLWRQECAAKINIPPFKVINNKTLLDLARVNPHNKQEILSVKGITTTVWRRHGQNLLNAVRRGERRLDAVVPPPATKRRGDGRKPVRWDDQKLVDSLKKWRHDKALIINIHHLAVLPGYALESVARERPKNVDELAAIEGIGKKRAREYSEEILNIIKENT